MRLNYRGCPNLGTGPFRARLGRLHGCVRTCCFSFRSDRIRVHVAGAVQRFVRRAAKDQTGNRSSHYRASRPGIIFMLSGAVAAYVKNL